jgi:hypothetical protein
VPVINRAFRFFAAMSIISVGMRANAAQAQGSNTLQNSVTLFGGAFIDDYGGDALRPFVSAGYERALNRFVELEGRVSYMRTKILLYSFNPIQSFQASTPFFAADVGANFILPLGRFAPYVGVSTGGFTRRGNFDYAGNHYDVRQSGPSLGGAIGARLLLGQRFGIRAEFHYRGDQPRGADNPANNVEQSLGLIYRF